ncbi:hypothetical protein [Polyangium sp. 6x1]|uniref:hypothetical protein n=1 Tax=Polyangium sp. 6x1 TaxID=3042689 RepID=UPI002482ABE3|nr:hypothetical protein [Polyangium sp. 6x1]MDI1444064.1 hypothetical protein [Polyangium sp. 6x1]
MTKLDSCPGGSVDSLRLGLATLVFLVPLSGCQDLTSGPEGAVPLESAAVVGRSIPVVAEPAPPSLTPPGGTICDPYEWQPCYYGPPGTEGVGICTGGYQECSATGTEWYECDDVRPQVEVCTNDVDDDCDGEVNEGCVCLPWEKEECCVGEGQSLVCTPGVRPCSMDGLSWGECVPVGLTCADSAGPSGTHNWSFGYGDTGQTFGSAVETDGDCNVYVTGTFDGTVDLGGGPVTSLVNLGRYDMYLAKFDAGGHHVWSKFFQYPSGTRSSSGFTRDGAGHVILTGSFQGGIDLGAGPMVSAGGNDIYVGKFDGAGNLIWGRRFGGTGHDFGGSVVTDAAGNIFLSGPYDGTLDFGAGPMTSTGFRDVYLVKLDPNGNTLWSRSYGNAGNNSGMGLVVDGAGSVHGSFTFSGTLNIGGTSYVSAGKYDLLLLNVDTNGNVLWSRRVGGTGDEGGGPQAIDAAGNVYYSGSFENTVDFGGGPLVSAGRTDSFLFKLDASGNHVFSKRHGDAGLQSGGDVNLDQAGNVILSGSWNGTMDFGGGPVTVSDTNVFVVNLDSSGNHLSTRHYGFGSASDLSVHPSGNVVMTGNHVNLLDFGGGSLPPSQKPRGFLASFVP